MGQDPDVIVVGGGAGGIFAAWRAAQLGARVILVEKTPRIGTKILISGGGKCNVAHSGPLQSVLSAFRPNEAAFIRSACFKLPNDKIIELMTEGGLRVYTRPDGRVFPIDQTAKDVVAILRNYLDDAGVEIRTESPVEELLTDDGGITGIRIGKSFQPHTGFNRGTEPRFGAKALLAEVLSESESERRNAPGYVLGCKSLVLATGGSSYPNSGTTGDGWPWARKVGHHVVKVRAALAPIYLVEPNLELAGVAVRDCILKARTRGKEVVKWRGDLLFTHQGVSGPNALATSRVIAEAGESDVVSLEVDFAPSLPNDRLATTYLEWITSNPKRSVKSSLEEWVPNRLVEVLMARANVASDLACSKLEKKPRNRLLELLKGLPIGTVRHVPIEKGEVVAGGISLDEVDPKTMRSLKIEGLFLCGEVLDIAGPVGGYNLQAAFSTGFLAGESAAKLALGLP
jgi:predicted flavoprotein YhiN